MAGNDNNLGAIVKSVAVHIVLLSAMVAAFDSSRSDPVTPLAIKGILVQEIPAFVPAAAIESEPEPAPVVEEPPEADNSEALRRAAEEEKRALDALIEQQRLDEIRKQEEAEREKQRQEEVDRERQEEAEREQQRRDEADKKRQEEETRERQLREAERKRQEDMQRQREENDRQRRELENEQRNAELEAEEQRFAARNSSAMDAYQFAIGQKISRNWSAPASAGPETRCTVLVTQLPGGEVTGVTIRTCNGDDAVKRSVEAAIQRSSPLPEPPDPNLFDRNLTVNLTLKNDY